MGLNAAVQALKKAEPLKDRVQQCKDLLADNDAWVCQQQLQKIYQQVLILDLEYALDRKVEQELWNLGFKNYIALLQSQAKDRKNPKRSESQAMLSWFLEAASGFYLTLLQEICTTFDLDLPFRRNGDIYGYISPWKVIEKLAVPHKSSCFYACQYCLVHLGDIARYRNQNRQAELFYRHAVSLSPSSGQPYNQLALLDASRGDKLGTVFHYVRSVAVKHPFPVATSNLAKTLSSALGDNSLNISEKTKLNSQEYVILFLKLHGILHNLGDLKLAKKYMKILAETMTALVATESFTSWRLIQMLIINLYTLHHIAGNTFESSLDLIKIDQLSSDERVARNCILDLIAASLSALLLPVYTIKNSYVDYFALPSIKLCLDWIRQRPVILEEPAFSSRLQIWPSLCALLNGLQSSVGNFKVEYFTRTPLPEDRDLQGCLLLERSFESLRFCHNDLEGDTASMNKLRAARLINLGRYLAQCQANGGTLINVISMENNFVKFTCRSDASGPSNELMKELEELSLNKERQMIFATSPVPSESASSKGSSETEVAEPSLFERKIGILKPQGSLERSKDSLASSSSNNLEVQISSLEVNGVSSARKTRQNIAMQAIMRRAENEQKQVTFKNISPMIVEEIDGKGSQLSNLEHFTFVKSPVVPAQNYQSLAQAITPHQRPIVSQVLSPILTVLPNHPQTQNQDGHCCQEDQQVKQNQYPTSELINQKMSLQATQYDKNFYFNRIPQVSQLSVHNFSAPLSTVNVHAVLPKVAQTLTNNIPHTNKGLNFPQGIIHQQDVSNEAFIDGNILQQRVGLASIGNYPKTFRQPFQVNSSEGFGFPSPPYFKSVGQVGQIPPSGQLSQLAHGQINKSMAPIPQNLPFPTDFGVNVTSSSHQQGNYSTYRNYESDFNPWKDTQPPPPPVTWWGTVDKEKSEIGAFQSWVNNPVTTICMPVTSASDYSQKPCTVNENPDGGEIDQPKVSLMATANTYSLFSGNSWGTSVTTSNVSTQNQPKSRLAQQSLWSGPGPSPLERLLEQQKFLREGGT